MGKITRGWAKYARQLLTSVFLVSGFIAFSQNVTVTGRVVNDKNEPIAGASVTVSGTTDGTTTNADGSFSLSVERGKVLNITSVGYGTQTITVSGASAGTITLSSTATDLQDVVVVGYGTQRKVTVTGSVAQVRGAELTKTPTVNLSNTLAGRLPGITAINYSGEPGYDGSALRIRGINSIGNSDALVVIDGVPGRSGGLERINSADIESISVLKDAAAAIYGSRAANGVILITTKRGKTGKPVLSYTFNQGWAQPTRIPKMSNAVEYSLLRNELAVYENLPPAQWSNAYNALISTGSYTNPDDGRVIQSPMGYSPADIALYKSGENPWTHPNTDWFGTTFKEWSPQSRHNLQISGGTDAIRYMSSIGYQNQDGYYRNSATYYKQYDVRFNIDANVNKYISIAAGILGREEDRNFPTRSAGDIFWMLVRGKPNEQAVWPNGLPGRDIEYGNNPVVIGTNATGYNKDKRDYIQTNGKIEFKIPGVEGLKLTGTAALDKYIRNNKNWQTPWYLYSWNGSSFEADGKTPLLSKELRSNFTDARLSQGTENSLNINLTTQLNYDKTFGDHTVNFLAGIQKETATGENMNAFRRYFISSSLDQLFAGGDQEKNNGGGAFNRARLSYYGRVGYNFQEKYLAEFLWRYDGSYTFPEHSRFGFFPGVTVGWRVSQEDFFKDAVPFIDNMKIRASWGQMGAEPYLNGNLAEYQFLSTYGFSSYIINNVITRSLYETRLPNPNFTWEVGNNSNVGLDLAFLKNRLSVELDYFINKRSGALIPNVGQVPSTAGLVLPPENLGELENRGGEFNVRYNSSAGDVRFSVGANGGYTKNKIVKWTEPAGVPEWQRSTGRRLGTNGPGYLAYQFDGVFMDQAEIDKNTLDYSAVAGRLEPGDMKVKDYNNDGKINGDDMVRMNKTRDPYFTYGFSGNADYKNFDFSILFQGAAGGIQPLSYGSSGDIGNYLQYFYNNHWSVANPNPNHPRIVSRNNRWFANQSYDYWLKSNNYLRLKNVELGYTLGLGNATNNLISNVRVFANGLNLITWDKLKVWDPESAASEGVQYPQSRIINIGATVTF